MDRSLALIVDRDPAVRAALSDALDQRRLTTLGAGSAAEALQLLGTRPIGLLFIDLDAGAALTGELLPRARRLQPGPLIIGLVTANLGSVAAEASEQGLFGLLEKPLSPERLGFLMDRALSQLSLLAETVRLREALQCREGFRGIVGRSAAAERQRARLDRLAPTELSVWLSGEGGAGKSLAARTLHAASARAERPFVAVDCQAFSRTEWDAHLNSSPGPAGAPEGLLPQARGGTLYLERVPALDLGLQEKLLATLARWDEPGSGVKAAGAPRLLAGSVEEPASAVERGLLLPALHRRLAQATLQLQPLRDRREDIPLLCRHFVTTICEINQLPPIRLAPDTLRLLERYRWPANIRELRQAVEHAVIMASGEEIRPEDLPEQVREEAAGPAPAHPGLSRFRTAKRGVVDAFERSYLSKLMARHGGNVTLAAEQAGMLRSALQRLLRKHRLKSADFRKSRRPRRRRESVEQPLD